MKKNVSIIIFLLFTGSASAQIAKGSLFFGGGFNINSNKTETAADDLKSSSFSIEPSGGYFISDNLAIGLDLGFTSSTLTNEDKESEFAFGPFVRFYKFLDDESKFAIYGQGVIDFSSGKNDPNDPLLNETKFGSTTVYVAPGFAYFFNKKWALDFQLRGISFTSSDPNKNVDNNKQTGFNFGASSFSPSLGFRYFISK